MHTITTPQIGQLLKTILSKKAGGAYSRISVNTNSLNRIPTHLKEMSRICWILYWFNVKIISLKLNYSALQVNCEAENADLVLQTLNVFNGFRNLPVLPNGHGWRQEKKSCKRISNGLSFTSFFFFANLVIESYVSSHSLVCMQKAAVVCLLSAIIVSADVYSLKHLCIGICGSI